MSKLTLEEENKILRNNVYCSQKEINILQNRIKVLSDNQFKISNIIKYYLSRLRKKLANISGIK